MENNEIEYNNSSNSEILFDLVSLHLLLAVMSGRRETNSLITARSSAGSNSSLIPSSSHQEPSDVGSDEIVEGTPKAKTPPKPSRLTDEELKALAKSGGLLTIDRAFDLFGAGSLYFRRLILIYSLLFLLVDCSWQLIVDMDRKIDEANERTLSPLCTHFCGCPDLHERTIPTMLKSIGDATKWGQFYMPGIMVASVVLIFTESIGRKKPLLFSILMTAAEMFAAIWLRDDKIPMMVFILLFGISTTITYVCLFVNALESLPFKLRLPFALFFFTARRVSRGLISSLALYTQGYHISLIVCTLFLLLAAIVTYLFIDETAAHLLLQEKMYELELLFDRIEKDADLLPSRTSQQIADELGFREEDADIKTKEYLGRVFKSKALLYIVNVVVLVSVVVACMPIVSKRFHLMGIDSTFTSFAITLFSVPIFIPLVLYSNTNRFQSLTSIELGAGISMLALWCFTEGEVTVCSDSTVYSGLWWWAELVLLIINEAFSYAVYIVGSVAMVEVVPTRARTFTVALLYTVSVICAGATTRIIRAEKRKVSRFTLEIPIAASIYLLFALLSTLSYSAPARMVDYLVDIIPKQKSVRRVRKVPRRKKTQAEINFPDLPSNVAEMTNLVEEDAHSKTREDTV